MFLHLGFGGYRAVALQDLQNARTLSRALENSGYYDVLSEIHRTVSSSVVESVKLKIDQGDIEVCITLQETIVYADRSKNYQPGLPVVAFRFSEAFRTKYPDVNQKWIQTLLRSKGWIVPNYELAPDLSDVEILRVVVRETVSEVLIERLIADIVGPLGAAPSSVIQLPVCRSISPSLLPRLTRRLTLSTSFQTPKDMGSVMRFTTERLTRILHTRVLARMPSSVEGDITKGQKIERGGSSSAHVLLLLLCTI